MSSRKQHVVVFTVDTGIGAEELDDLLLEHLQW